MYSICNAAAYISCSHACCRVHSACCRVHSACCRVHSERFSSVHSVNLFASCHYNKLAKHRYIVVAQPISHQNQVVILPWYKGVKIAVAWLLDIKEALCVQEHEGKSESVQSSHLHNPFIYIRNQIFICCALEIDEKNSHFPSIVAAPLKWHRNTNFVA